MRTSRTLPRVRELKRQLLLRARPAMVGRTLPRVRELKQNTIIIDREIIAVAPFPGCVN